MTAAKRNQSKKGKAAKSPKTKASSFLKPKKIGEKKKKASKKEKPVSHFPTKSAGCDELSLAERMDLLAAAESVEKAAKRKVAEYRAILKGYLLEDFAHRWASEGPRPATRVWKGLRSKLNYVMTSKITFNESKQEAIEEELNIKMDKYFEVVGIKIDLATLQENQEYFDAFMTFLESIDDEDRDKFVERTFKLKKDFFGKIGDICDHNPDRLHRMLQILVPQANLSGIEHSGSEEDLFDLVRDTEG